MAYPTSTLTYWTTLYGAAGGEWERDKTLYDNTKDIASHMPCTQSIDIPNSADTSFASTFGGADPENVILGPKDTTANDTLVSGYYLASLTTSDIGIAGMVGSGKAGSAYATVVYT